MAGPMSFENTVTVKNSVGTVIAAGGMIMKFTGSCTVAMVGTEVVVNVIPGAVVGNPNRVVIFDALGAIADSPDLLYDDTTKKLQLNGQFGIDVAPQAKFQSTVAPLTAVYVSSGSGFVFATMMAGFQTVQDFDVFFGEDNGSNSDATGLNPGLAWKFAAGLSNHVTGGASAVFGFSNQVFGATSFACCEDNYIGAVYAGFAANQFNQVLHNRSACFGYGNITTRANSFLCGEFSLPQADEIFCVGNGTGVGTENNAFSVREDGEAQIDFGISINEANTRMGVATLVGGVVVVPNAFITANSRIFLTTQTPGGTPGFVYVGARTVGVDFTIQSSNALDTSVVAYLIVEPL